jgi:hypothetical protein
LLPSYSLQARASNRSLSHVFISGSGHATALEPNLTGLGKSPFLIFAYNVERFKPVRLSTSGLLKKTKVIFFSLMRVFRLGLSTTKELQ